MERSFADRLSGEYLPDILNSPSIAGGVEHAEQHVPGNYEMEEVPPYTLARTKTGGMTPRQMIKASRASPTPRPFATRRSTAYQWNIEDLPKFQKPTTPKGASYFKGNVVEGIGDSPQEQLLEEIEEKACRTRLHVASSYLQRAYAAKQAGNKRAFQSEMEKFYRGVPYAVARKQEFGPLRQLREQGLNITGYRMGECGINYNFENIPTTELYAAILLYGNSAVVIVRCCPLKNYPSIATILRIWRRFVHCCSTCSPIGRKTRHLHLVHLISGDKYYVFFY